MKNKELHNFVEAFDIEAPNITSHQAKLKRAVLLVQPHEQSTIARFRSALLNKDRNSMKRTKIFASTSFAAVAVMALIGFTIAQVSNSPRAAAESLTSKGIQRISQLNPQELNQVTTTSNPVKTLQEALKAKDLMTITREQYIDLAKTSKIVDTNSAPATMPDGGTVSSASVSAGGQQSNTEQGTMTTMASTTTTSAPTSDQSSAQGQSAPAVRLTPGSSSSDPMYVQAAPIPNLDPIKGIPSTASRYIRFTNSDGNTVVIGFDKTDTPLFLSVFTK